MGLDELAEALISPRLTVDEALFWIDALNDLIIALHLWLGA